ncbi:MAG: hypothetical protein LBH25_10300 [Fibromonadaceae bacterium]|jgi:hypothetical protein|nr:hypothetical protein [Fibromonadaceae bacterium]
MSLHSLVSSIFLFFLLISCSTDSDDNLVCKESAGELIIGTAEELIEFAKSVNGGDDFLCKTVKLNANIMLNDTTDWQNWGEAGLIGHPNTRPANTWTPIGRSFNGTFDGNGFVVSGVYTRGAEAGGFFGWLDSNGTIKNFGIVASYIGYQTYVGGLVNTNYGKISNSYFIGLVYGESVGGLVQDNSGTINNSYSSGTVLGMRNVGGLVVYNGNGRTINNSYSNSLTKGATVLGGAISGDRVGGLVGCNCGLINNSYSSGKIAGSSNIGGLVGASPDDYCEGKVINSYYDKEISYQNDEGKGEGKTTAEMRQQSTFVGWDFDKIWGINNTMNDGYPYLLKFAIF